MEGNLFSSNEHQQALAKREIGILKLGELLTGKVSELCLKKSAATPSWDGGKKSLLAFFNCDLNNEKQVFNDEKIK